ncbi:TRAP transporter substrate-binding protein [Glutamicibacter sp.]|uniref:TRAP transporter substrate-binding protein n=1 Tax=Glutamicibacter sp. TaxID=1931995 RepID=UPI002B46E339|nr:TRAP transporter substrate-binding protein [Glutamicibacter sp.]HJX79311.1 TRAP transporter substrate-binding protein [Glutamicibacter sp.]
MNLRKRASILLVAAAMIFSVAGCATAGESDDGFKTFRLGMVAASGSVQHKSAERFAKKISDDSDGKLQVEVFPSGQIGSDESLGQDLSMGGLDFAFLNQGSMAGMDPLLDFHYLPYIAANYAQADKLFYGDGIIPTTMHETLAKNNIRALGWYELEYRGVSTSDGAVHTPQDLEGQKIRVPGSAAIRAFFEQLHAHPTTIPFPELYTALQQRTVDGQDNGLILTFDNRFYEINKFYTMIRHVYATGTIAMSEEAYEGLSEEEAAIVENAAQDAQTWEVAEERKLTDSYIKKMREDGVEVTELTESELSAFQTVGQSVWQQMEERYGADRIAQLRQEVNAVKNLK